MVHAITERAKSPESVEEKIQRKSYSRPADKFDDLIGVRVITLLDKSVSDVSSRLRSMFAVDEGRSANKSAQLQMRQVGYRSEHVVLKVNASGLGDVSGLLRSTYVEVQVRSVISHAWAEIEHSLRYKIGDGIPDSLSRRFDALAGTLELVDREFDAIEQDTLSLVDARAKDYASRVRRDDPLSTVQLLAALKYCRPEMEMPKVSKIALPIEDAFRLSKILNKAGCANVATFIELIQSQSVLSIIRAYADSKGLDPEAASGAVVVGAAIGAVDLVLFKSLRVSDDQDLAAAVIEHLGEESIN